MPRLPDTQAAGAAIMAAAMLVAPCMDMCAKLLSDTMSPGQIATGRFAVQTLVLVPFMPGAGWGLPGRLHLVAGAVLAAGLLAVNTALAQMPVANVIAIFFVEPLILTLLSAAVLGERLGAARLGAVALGLAGALIVIRPNWAAYGPTAVLPVIAAVCFAVYLLITRVLSQRGAAVAMQFWVGLIAGLLSAAATLAGDRAGIGLLTLSLPDARGAALMAAMGLVAALIHQMMAQAFARAEAGLLAPLRYLEILSAVAIGWAVWGDVPDPLTAFGTAIIIAAGLIVLRRARSDRRGAGG